MRGLHLLFFCSLVAGLSGCNDKPSSEQVSTVINDKLKEGPSLLNPDMKYLDQSRFDFKLAKTSEVSQRKETTLGLNVACVTYKLTIMAVLKADAISISENTPFRNGMTTSWSRSIASVKTEADKLSKGLSENSLKGKCLEERAGLFGVSCVKYEQVKLSPTEVSAKVKAYYADIYKHWKFRYLPGSEFPLEGMAELCTNKNESPQRWLTEHFSITDPADRKELDEERLAAAAESKHWQAL